MDQDRLDTVILGQGLAGSALAWHLVRAGERVCVIDDGHASAASMVAAGLINPLAGMRFNRRPELHDWLNAAEAWYTELEHFCGHRFWHPRPMLRLFRSAEQRRFYQRQREDPGSRDLLGEAFAADRCPEPIHAPHGGFIQHRTGYIDLPALLGCLRDWLKTEGHLLEHHLSADQIDCHGRGVVLPDLYAKRLVFCDGARLGLNPWFNHLPLAPNKGEILDLADSEWRPRHIINGACWLVPLETGGLRLGATHTHHRVDDRPTTEGRQTLLQCLANLLPNARPAHVIQHRAGVRPGTPDRYPLIGPHPKHSQLWVFNGLGARGALLAPWYAQRLCAHYQSDAPLPAEADSQRFAGATRC